MRVRHVVSWLLLLSLLAAGCAEQAQCVERRVGGRDQVVVECSTGKVAMCGDRPELLYDENTGALLPTPAITESNPTGSCDGISGPCRPRPVCGAAGQAPMCANGETAICRLGRVQEITPGRDAGPPPELDAGPMEEDAGPMEEDAGPMEEDAGPMEEDAGP
ncbi:MAG: hypothetical protein KF729_18455 [Sandaracinaceae bacterium]|nr:hypothetical protein [Sandaracinaceae bacterium]